MQPRTLLEDKLFFTHLPFWPEVQHLVDVGSGPLAEVSTAAQAARTAALHVTCVDSALGMGWGHYLANVAGKYEIDGLPTALLFSSVIHELFSDAKHYGGADPRSFWADVAGVGPQYVIVRDMAFACQNYRPTTATLYRGVTVLRNMRDMIARSGFIEAAELIHHRMDAALNALEADADVSKYAANILRECVELMLKKPYIGPESTCTYAEKRREAEEHYFSLDPKPFVECANLHDYEVIHERRFLPDYIRDNVFGTTPVQSFTTHIEYVFARK